MFKDWFISTKAEIGLFQLPQLKKLLRVNVVIGDNLTFQINLENLKVCEENNIRFVYLPTNSIHLIQSLNVTYYGPIKREWYKIL